MRAPPQARLLALAASLCLLPAVGCRPEIADRAPAPEPENRAAAQDPAPRPDADQLDAGAASPTPPTEDPMPTPDALEPPWAAACQIAQEHLGDEQLRSCLPVAPGGARAPFLLALRTERQKRRLLVHEGRVVAERGPEALASYLSSLGFPVAGLEAPILWELVHLFEVLPEAWRFGAIPEGHWDKPEGWMRAATRFYRPGEQAVELTSSPEGATFTLHRTIQPGGDPFSPQPVGQGVKKDEDQRLIVTFDAKALIRPIKIERREGGKWRPVR